MSFYFLNALQSDNNSNRVYVLGHKYVLGPSRTHFSPRLAARAKMSLSRAQNIFMPANINSIVILNEGVPVTHPSCDYPWELDTCRFKNHVIVDIGAKCTMDYFEVMLKCNSNTSSLDC